uniref:NAC domain-containing protein n=1 Tax=Aegilops tauschii subsp. strangulata TaxID=200361 RepID=A0A453QJ27_AEGTS
SPATNSPFPSTRLRRLPSISIMSIPVNGQSVVPPGFRFHPTEEELLTYYLAKKVAS